MASSTSEIARSRDGQSLRARISTRTVRPGPVLTLVPLPRCAKARLSDARRAPAKLIPLDRGIRGCETMLWNAFQALRIDAVFGIFRMLSTETDERRVKGLAPVRPVHVEVDWGTGYELVLGLRMLVDREEEVTSYTAGEAWFERARRLAGGGLLRTGERYAGGHEITFGYLLAIVADTQAPRDAGRFLARLRQTSPRDLR